MEDHAHSGWLCALVTDVDDTRLRVTYFVQLLAGHRSNRTRVWASQLHTQAELTSAPRPALKTVTGEVLRHYGQRSVDSWCQGEELPSGLHGC